MALRINTNIASLNAQRSLTNNTAKLNRSLEKLSSGMRINRAADDAAGLAISESLKSDIKALEQAGRNAADGVSLVQMAEGSLDEVSGILVRMRELAEQAANETMGSTERGYINTDELWVWRKAVIDGKVERKSGSVILCADDGSEVMRYNFFEAWPCKWKGFTLDGKGTDVNIEEIELAVEKVERG